MAFSPFRTVQRSQSNTPTTDHIVVEAGATANITLSGVNIGTTATLDDFCAFKIEDDSTGDVTITLADGTENTLTSVGLCAGLQKNGSGDNIGTGKFIATGGTLGAGIGGGTSGEGSDIVITGGSVKAVSKYER